MCEKSEALLLMLVGLMAGRPAVRRNTGTVCTWIHKFINSLSIALLRFSQCLMKEHCYHDITNAFWLACCVGAKKWDAMFFVSILIIKYYRT